MEEMNFSFGEWQVEREGGLARVCRRPARRPTCSVRTRTLCSFWTAATKRSLATAT